MAGKNPREIAEGISVDTKSRYFPIKSLVLDGFFDLPVSSEEVVLRIKEKFGKRWKTSWVQTYMRRFMEATVIHAVKPTGLRGNYWVLSNVKRENALRYIGKGRKVQEIQASLFSPMLASQLKKDFGRELEELHDNFGKHGNCTAFLLRKILEKLIIIAFGKHSKEALLHDKNRPGGWVGLKEMIDTAAREKLDGVPFLVSKTANEIRGIKFLGDTAAHNPLVSVDTNTILPQMPFIITAYEELAARL